MTEMETLASEFQQMKIALQEIGVVGNAYGKTAGVIEKQQGKLSAAFHKTPVGRGDKRTKEKSDIVDKVNNRDGERHFLRKSNG